MQGAGAWPATVESAPDAQGRDLRTPPACSRCRSSQSPASGFVAGPRPRETASRHITGYIPTPARIEPGEPKLRSLENRCRGNPPTESSNPSPSAFEAESRLSSGIWSFWDHVSIWAPSHGRGGQRQSRPAGQAAALLAAKPGKDEVVDVLRSSTTSRHQPASRRRDPRGRHDSPKPPRCVLPPCARVRSSRAIAPCRTHPKT